MRFTVEPTFTCPSCGWVCTLDHTHNDCRGKAFTWVPPNGRQVNYHARGKKEGCIGIDVHMPEGGAPPKVEASEFPVCFKCVDCKHECRNPKHQHQRCTKYNTRPNPESHYIRAGLCTEPEG